MPTYEYRLQRVPGFISSSGNILNLFCTAENSCSSHVWQVCLRRPRFSPQSCVSWLREVSLQSQNQFLPPVYLHVTFQKVSRCFEGHCTLEVVTYKVEAHVLCGLCRIKRFALCCGNKKIFAIRPSSVSESNGHVHILVRKNNLSRCRSVGLGRRQMSGVPTTTFLEEKSST